MFTEIPERYTKRFMKKIDSLERHHKGMRQASHKLNKKQFASQVIMGKELVPTGYKERSKSPSLDGTISRRKMEEDDYFKWSRQTLGITDVIPKRSKAVSSGKSQVATGGIADYERYQPSQSDLRNEEKHATRLKEKAEKALFTN